MQTPQRQRSRVTATCWEVTPPCQRLQDMDMDMESRNLVLKLTSCQGKSSSELQGFTPHELIHCEWRNDDGVTPLPGLVLLREHQPQSSSGHQQWPPWAGSQSKQAFFSTNQCFHTGLQTPDLSPCQTQLHNLISGFSPFYRSGRGKSSTGFLKRRC